MCGLQINFLCYVVFVLQSPTCTTCCCYCCLL